MAGGSLYHDDEDAAAITDINVTPFVDVVLVLLVVFMITAKLIIARGVDVDKAKEAHGNESNANVRISIKADGSIWVEGNNYPTDDAAVAKIREKAAQFAKPKALIDGDRHASHGAVMHAIELAQRAEVTAIVLANERPE